MSLPFHRWHIFETPEVLAGELAARISRHAAEAIRQRGSFSIVLAGGETPRAVYENLAASGRQWDYWNIYLSDERCLPSDHAGRNSIMLQQSLLDRIDIPDGNVHMIPAEMGPAKGAREYENVLRGVPLLDFVLLGIGEDGHTASLFPGHPLGDHPDSASVLPVHDAPKLPSERVSLSARRLGSSREVCVVATGNSKAMAIQKLNRGDDLPVSAIRPGTGVDIYLDTKAWRLCT